MSTTLQKKSKQIFSNENDLMLMTLIAQYYMGF